MDADGSFFNNAEIHLIGQSVMTLLEKGISPSCLGVICLCKAIF
jgi:hypothetical protein